MSTLKHLSGDYGDKTALVVGAGGLGCPAALALVRAGIGRLLVADDDVVEVGNLHRQILYEHDDVGADKVERAVRRLRAESDGRSQVVGVPARLLPDVASRLLEGVDVVLEGADNFATKFLAADACHLQGVPVVHGAAIRWRATVWAVGPQGRPCYRCLFEDLPPASAQLGCSEAGVMGPVVGLAGALMADLALRLLGGDTSVAGRLHSYDGRSDRLRAVQVSPRASCALCGSSPTIHATPESLYLTGPHAA